MAWCLTVQSDDSACYTPKQFLLPQKSPNVIMRVSYMDTGSPNLFKKTADGWLECDVYPEIKDDKSFWYTSGETHFLGAVEEFDYLHAALVALLPHPLLISFRRRIAMFLSQVFRITRKIIPRKQFNPARRERWELVHEIVKNLGNGWQVKSASLYDEGLSAGRASGPGNMELSFIARAKKVERGYRHNYPPLGWLRVDGQINFIDGNVDLSSLEGPIITAKISIELPDSMTADEMANEIIARLLPLYAGFLSVVEKHRLELGTKS